MIKADQPDQPAKRQSWQTKPMPARSKPLEFRRRLSPAERERVALGFTPEVMEDKWFIFCEEDRIFFHRSWTGNCIFEARLCASGEAYEIDEVIVSRDPDQYRNEDDDEDRRLLNKLLDGLIDRDGPFAHGNVRQRALDALTEQIAADLDAWINKGMPDSEGH
jgi:hypothetical protein